MSGFTVCAVKFCKFDECIMSPVHHHSSVQNSFTTLNPPWDSLIYCAPSTIKPHQPLIILLSLQFAFSSMSCNWNYVLCHLFRLLSLSNIYIEDSSMSLSWKCVSLYGWVICRCIVYIYPSLFTHSLMERQLGCFLFSFNFEARWFQHSNTGLHETINFQMVKCLKALLVDQMARLYFMFVRKHQSFY